MVRFPRNGRSCAVAVSAILLLAAGCTTGHSHARVVRSASKPPSASPSASGYVKRADFLTGVACLSARMCVAVGWYYYGAAGPSLTMAARWNGRAWLAEPTPAGATTVASTVSPARRPPPASRWVPPPRRGPACAGSSSPRPAR